MDTHDELAGALGDEAFAEYCASGLIAGARRRTQWWSTKTAAEHAAWAAGMTDVRFIRRVSP